MDHPVVVEILKSSGFCESEAYLLSSRLAVLLALPVDAPFASDVEYMNVLEAMYSCRCDSYSCRSQLTTAVSMLHSVDLSHGFNVQKVEFARKVAGLLDRCTQKLKEIAQAKLRVADENAVCKTPPRIERAIALLDLSAKEADLLRCAFSTTNINTRSYAVLLAVCDFTEEDIAESRRADRKIVKERILMVERSLWFLESVVHAEFFWGASISASTMYRFHKDSVLRVLLREEGVGDDDIVLEQELEAAYREIKDEKQMDAAFEEQTESRAMDMIRGLLDTEKEAATTVVATAAESTSKTDEMRGGSDDVYATDLEFIADLLDWIFNTCAGSMLNPSVGMPNCDPETIKSHQQYVSKAASADNRIRMKLDQCRARNVLLPRFERVCSSQGLSKFERMVLAVCIGSSLRYDAGANMAGSFPSNIRSMVQLYCGESLMMQVEMISRFFRSAPLVSSGLIKVVSAGGLFSASSFFMDQRMLDFFLGVDSSLSNLVEGSSMSIPTENLDRVILPPAMKDRMVHRVRDFLGYQSFSAKSGVKTLMSSSFVLLLHGPSGTGKTMFSKGLANHFGKMLLHLDMPTLMALKVASRMFSVDAIQLVFREAYLKDAFIFFDECDDLFHSRSKGNRLINEFLIYLEKFHGVCILATNRSYDLDEALHRRITMTQEFVVPNAELRSEIWKIHVPDFVTLNNDVDFGALAVQFELTGGLIRNAMSLAVAEAFGRCRDDARSSILLTASDLHDSASAQLKKAIGGYAAFMGDAVRFVVPRGGVETLVLSADVHNSLSEVVYCAAESKNATGAFRTAALLLGVPGVGKRSAAAAMAFDLGLSVHFVPALSIHDQQTLRGILAYASSAQTMVVFEDVDRDLLTSRLIKEMIGHTGIIVCTYSDAFDSTSLTHVFQHIVKFSTPDATTRSKLFRALTPKLLPLSEDVDFAELGSTFEFTPRKIYHAVVRAAARAANRTSHTVRQVCMADLVSVSQAVAVSCI
eukprot:ANDGO_03462.mRNA.1 Protein SAV